MSNVDVITKYTINSNTSFLFYIVLPFKMTSELCFHMLYNLCYEGKQSQGNIDLSFPTCLDQGGKCIMK